jgi:hypothetical protein
MDLWQLFWSKVFDYDLKIKKLENFSFDLKKNVGKEFVDSVLFATNSLKELILWIKSSPFIRLIRLPNSQVFAPTYKSSHFLSLLLFCEHFFILFFCGRMCKCVVCDATLLLCSFVFIYIGTSPNSAIHVT